jgi:hypothetical protein
MAITPVYSCRSADGKTFERVRRARTRWNVMKLVTMMLVETVRKVEADQSFALSVTGLSM